MSTKKTATNTAAKGKRTMNTEASPSSNGTAVAHTDRQVLVLPMGQIDRNYENARSGNWQKAEGGPDEERADGSAFKDFKRSIVERGLDVPVVVRPKGNKYELIAGFRRDAVLREVYAEGGTVPGLVKGTIRVEVRLLSDGEARALNIRENAARDNLKGADLMWGIHAMKGDTDMPISAIAAELGKNQSYCNKLYGIIKNAPKEAAKWRANDILGYEQMLRIAAIKDPTERAAKYEEMCGKQGTEPKNTTARGMAWLARATRKAQLIGTITGTLARPSVGIIVGKEHLVFDQASLEACGVKLSRREKGSKVDKPATAKQAAAVVAAAQAAYMAAYEAPEKEEGEEEEEEEAA